MKSSGDKGGRRVASHHWAGVVVALLLHSCSAVPEPRGLEVFRGEFRDLEAFCPDGMRSYWYRIQSTPDGTIREFRCGTNFKLLTLARVEYEGVTVEDHGDHGVDSVRLAELGRLEQRSDGLSLWRREGAEALYPRHPGMEKAVATVVDGRYVVMATSEDLLVAALQDARSDLPYPYGVVLDEKRARLYVSFWAQSCVGVIDVKTRQLITQRSISSTAGSSAVGRKTIALISPLSPKRSASRNCSVMVPGRFAISVSSPHEPE